MDYCSSCRRTLNGALVCPGCGAYAPDIAPPDHRVHSTVPSAATTHEVWPTTEVLAPGPSAGARHSAAAAIADAASDAASGAASEGAVATASDGDASAELEGSARTGQGRAARRRQLARWKKHRRRAVAATAVALVGGGLTIAAMPSTRPSTSHALAAPPPEPVTKPAAPQTAAAVPPQERPDRPGSQEPAAPSRTTAQERNTAVATPAASTTVRQPGTVAAAEPSAPGGAAPRTGPASGARTGAATGAGTDTGTVDAPAPETTAPVTAEERPAGSGSSLLGLVPTTSGTDPASPTQVCLIGVCLG
ncbi:SCO2400 family protein [Streptomyces sp. NPDC003027]